VIRTDKAEKEVLAELKEIGMGEFLVRIEEKGNERKGMKYRSVLLIPKLDSHKLVKWKSPWFESLVDALRWARDTRPAVSGILVARKEDVEP